MTTKVEAGEPARAAGDWTTLVSAEALAAALGAPRLVLVDARAMLSDPDAGERAWRESHLPGARHVHLERDLSDHAKPADHGRHPLPEPAAFAATLARLGVRPDSQVVVYDGGDGAMAAARFWWLLRIAGHARVAVLDGGFARWTALGLPVEAANDADGLVHSKSALEAESSSGPVSFDRHAIASTDEIAARLDEAPGWLIDARGAERFRGDVEPLDPVAGHIPGARNRPFPHNLRDGVFKPADELRADFARLLAGRDPHDVVLQCGSGVTACHNLLAMEHAGLHGARVYAPSWSGWVSDRSRPVATGD
jgi:thiosulfate/3-mercaptopyruvate sulfurtransferase